MNIEQAREYALSLDAKVEEVLFARLKSTGIISFFCADAWKAKANSTMAKTLDIVIVLNFIRPHPKLLPEP